MKNDRELTFPPVVFSSVENKRVKGIQVFLRHFPFLKQNKGYYHF